MRYALLALALLVGCGGDKPSSQPTPKPTETKTDQTNKPKEKWVRPKDAVDVKGKATFKGTHRARPEDVSSDKFCEACYKDAPLMNEDIVTENGALANVFVYVANPPDFEYETPSTEVLLDQRKCRYEPRVFGIMVRQTLAVRTSDDTTHNVHKIIGTNPRVNEGMNPKASDLKLSFQEPAFGEKVERFECNIHGWMRAYMHVMPHPFFGVSGKDGTFTIQGLPPGTYEFVAWHEKLGTQKKTLKIPDETPSFEFSK